MFRSLGMFMVLSASAIGIAGLSFERFPTFRELAPEEEVLVCGAGVLSNLECVAHSPNCVNGLVIGKGCDTLGQDGVQCNTSKTDRSCDSTWSYFGFDECSGTLDWSCPTGIIIRCTGVGGKKTWANKGVGNAACGVYDECI